MRKIHLLISLIVGLFSYTMSGQTSAQSNTYAPHTVIVELDAQQRKFIKHSVNNQQTLYSLCKFYNASIHDVMLANNLIEIQELSTDLVLKIPFNNELFYINKINKLGLMPVVYKVKPKDTVYNIAKSYFGQSQEHLCVRTGLKDFNLDVGDYLVVGYYDVGTLETISTVQSEKKEIKTVEEHVNPQSKSNVVDIKETITPVPPVEKSVPNLPTDKTEIHPQLSEVKDRTESHENLKPDNYRTVSKSGIAYWDKTKKKNGNSMLVLHKDAAPNTIIKIRNKLTGIEIFATVADNIPKNLYNSDIDVIISPHVAKKLGAFDSRFQVYMTYQKLQ